MSKKIKFKFKTEDEDEDHLDEVRFDKESPVPYFDEDGKSVFDDLWPKFNQSKTFLRIGTLLAYIWRKRSTGSIRKSLDDKKMSQSELIERLNWTILTI